MKITLTLRPLLFTFICMIFFAYSYAQVGNANFTYQAGCNGVFGFTAANQTYTTYQWTFGDNTTATGPTVVHDYASPGNYTVSLTITGPSPDSNVSFSQIYVGQFINQQITGPTSVCSGSSAGYTITNPSGSLQYNWLTSGATLSATTQADSVELAFPTAGPALLSVVINNGAGCDSILKQNITVNQTPILILPGHSNDSSQVRFTICQNSPVWYHVLTNTPGNITWSSPTGVALSAQGVDSMLFNFPTAGTTTIQIAEVTPSGCTDTVTAVITISANPAITVTADNACLGSNTDFTVASNPPGSPLTYQWIFDDGGQGAGPSVAHTFTTAGLHSGEVIATNQNGCVDTASATSVIDVNPGPAITCVGPVCAGAQEVYSTPVLSGVSYHWTVTGGTVTNGGGISDNTIAVTWGNGQMGTISLFLTGAGTYCSVPTTINVPILGGTLAIQGPSNPCYYSYVNYSTEVVPGGVYTWTLSTGSIISGQGTPNIQAYFYGTTPGTVSVNITHQILSCASSASLPVTPEGQFTVYGPVTVCAGISTTFSASGAGAFNWTVTGGTIVSGNGTPTIYVLFNTPGNYTVTAYIATGYCNTTANTNANVVARKQESIIGNALTCQGSNENYAISPNDQAYTWSLGHGGTIIGSTNGNSINVNWAQAGPDTVQVIYADLNGCPDTALFVVNVAPQDVPVITGDTLACQGTALNYSFTPVAGVGYVWETVGGVITSGQGTANVSVVWNGPQAGLLRLKNTGCNTFSQKHIVIRPTPLVNIETLNLTCAGTSADLKVIQDYPTYNWSNGLNTQDITITTTGVYTVTVTDSKGCTATGTENANPIPNLGFSSTSINISGPVSPYPYIYLILTAQSTPPAISYVWNDGNTAQNNYVTVTGQYSVTMTDKYGCTGVATTTVTTGTITNYTGGPPGNPPVILPCPGVSTLFTTNSPVCNPVQFTPGVTANDYLWNFGDNVYSSLSNPTHRFTTAGTQTITLNYSNDGVNWYQCTQNLVINSVMDINFTSTGTCNGATTLSNTSTSALPVSSVLWDFGDGTTSPTTPIVSHAFPNTAPSFLVTLTLNDGVCTDMAQQQVPTDQLVANFTYADVCVNNPALFNDATAHSNIIASYQWDFGNGQTADYLDPVTYFTTASNYTVNLTVTDANGCTSVSTQSVPVNQFGTLNITPSGPLTFCQGSSVDLSLPTGYTIYWNTGDTTSILHVTRGGVYYAYAQDNTTGCSGFSDTVTVIENIPPSAFISNQTGANQICTGSQLNLNGIPFTGVTYQWYLNGTTYSTNSGLYNYYTTSIQAGNYQLVITDANGCKDTSPILNIVVNLLPAYPNITQTPSGSPCSGQPVVLSVSGTDLFQWSNGTSGTSTTVYQSGFCNVVATNSFGCATSSNDYVTFNATPDFTLFPTGCYQICQSSNVTVSGPAGMQTYLWSNGANTQSITLSTSGTYTLSATSSDGCSASSGSFSIDVFGSSNLNLGNDTTICADQPLVLNAGAYPSIVWQDGSTNPTYNVVDSGLYWVKVKNSEGCISSDSIHVNIDTITLNLGDDTTICSTINMPLSVTGNFTSIVWQDGSTNATYTVTHSGLYKVSVTDIYGCKASDSVRITSVADSVFLGNDTALCFNATLQLQVTGTFLSVVWQDGSTNDNYTVTQPGIYKVKAMDAAGCTVSDSIVVTYHYPTVTLGDDTTLCNINHYILTVSDTFPGVIWQNGATGDTFTVTQSGLYSFIVTDSFGCKANASAQINSVADSVNLGTDSSICNHDSLVLHVTGSFTSIVWQDGLTGATYTVTQSGLYTVVATDAAGCTVSNSLQVTVHSPTVSLGDDTTLCPNTTLLLGVNGNFARIFWQDSVVSSTYLVSTAGFYVVMVTDSFGCEAKSSVTISYFTPIVFSPQPSQRLCDSTLTLSTGGIYTSYIWSNGATTETTTVTYPSEYYFTVTDQNGCSANDSVSVLTCDTNSCLNSYFIPNVFTPNGDGNNDEFTLKRRPNTEPSMYFSMTIFDRIGERIYETSDEFAGWDGSFKGQKAAEGVYVYVAHYVCNGGNVDVKGSVTLLR